MIGWGTKLVAAMTAAVLLAGGLAACGGSGADDGSTTTSTRTGETGLQGGSEGAAGDEGQRGEDAGQRESKDGQQPDASVPVPPLRVSGGGSAQFRVKGGDNSIQEFGEESDEGELEAAATALHDFYVARAREDWKTACDLLATTIAGQIEQLAVRAKSNLKGCPAALAAITPPLPPAVQRETTLVDAGSLRVEGDRGFLIYRGTEDTVYAINMAKEGGEWKVAALAGVPLS